MTAAAHTLDEAGIPVIKTARLTALDGHQALAHWPVISSILEGVIPYTCGRISLDDIRSSVEREDSMIVIAWDPNLSEVYAVFVCEGEAYPGKTVFNVNQCAGRKLEDWAHLYPDMKRLAKALGFQQIQITGRPGWGRALGIKETARVYIEEL